MPKKLANGFNSKEYFWRIKQGVWQRAKELGKPLFSDQKMRIF